MNMNHSFNTPDWVAHTNVYEVNLRQYTPEGTIPAFAKELPRLNGMGVKTLWFMPVTPISEKNKKGSMGSYYACSDYTAVGKEFGTLDDFRQLVKQAHELGMKVILDWVANHTGWDHTWTKEHPGWYEKDPATNDFKMASVMEDIIELDYKNPEMRLAMIEAMRFWVRECDIDGFRCDLAAWVELDFWQQARPLVDTGKALFWLGEFDELENPDYMTVFDACYTWLWMHRTRDFYQQRFHISELDHLLYRYSMAAEKGSMQIWFTSNHDENSWNGTEYDKYGAMAIMLAVFSATVSGIPLVYSGQELPNYKRLAFFDKDVIDWTGRYELAGFYQTLLRLHTEYPAFAAGVTETVPRRLNTTANELVFAFIRTCKEKEALLLFNFSDHHNLSFALEDARVTGIFKNVFTGEEKDFTHSRNFVLNGWGWQVFIK